MEKTIEEATSAGYSTGGLVEEVVFVSETGDDAAGDGSFEAPYKTVNVAMGNARIGVTCFTIHVINADATLAAGGGNVNIASILVWGSGINHPLYSAINNLTLGFPTVDSTITIGSDTITATGMEFETGGGIGIDVAGGTGILLKAIFLRETARGFL